MQTSASRARSIAVSLLIVNLCLAGTAEGHPEFNPVSVNRYWKLTLLSPSEIRLAYTIMFGAAPALGARKAADANSDGRLDADESAALGKRLQADVQKSLSLTLDGKPAQTVWEAPAVGLAGDEVGPAPFSVDLVVRMAVRGSPPHQLVLDDKTDLPTLGETEFRVEESPTTTLLASHRGPPRATGTEKEERILFRGPKSSLLEDRSITIRFANANANVNVNVNGRRVPWLPVGAAVGVLALLGIAWVVRRYRSMNG